MADKGNGKNILRLPEGIRVQKIRDIGSDSPVAPQSTMELRIKAANALGDLLGEHAGKEIPMKWNVYNLSMLHTLVSIGMRNAAAHNEESLVKVAGQFREAVSDMWLRLGMTIADCQILNQDVIIMAPRNPDKKKT